MPWKECHVVQSLENRYGSRSSQWGEGRHGSGQAEIDDTVSEPYGLSTGDFADLRRRLAREPTVVN